MSEAHVPSSQITHKSVRGQEGSSTLRKKDRWAEGKVVYNEYFQGMGFSEANIEKLSAFLEASSERNRNQLQRDLCRFAHVEGINLGLNQVRDLPSKS